MYYNSQWFSFLLLTNLLLVTSKAPYPLLIQLPSPLPHIYPAYVYFEGQSVLLTSESSFYLTINPDLSYSLSSAVILSEIYIKSQKNIVDIQSTHMVPLRITISQH